MSDVPEWLMRVRQQMYGSSRDAPRPRPAPAEAPSPFPMRGQPQPWERGTTMGGSVRLPTGPAPQRPQGQRPSLMSQYQNVVPVQGLMDTAGFVGGQAVRAPGRMLRGEPTNAMPPPMAQPEMPRLGRPGPMPEQTPPFPFTSPQAMRARLADVQEPALNDGGFNLPPPQMPARRGLEPPSAPRGMTMAEMEDQAWREAMERAARQRGQPLPTLADVQNRRDGASADRRY